jgi:hypothetical protein
MHAEPSHWLHEIFIFQNYLSPIVAWANNPIINWGYLFIYCDISPSKVVDEIIKWMGLKWNICF